MEEGYRDLKVIFTDASKRLFAKAMLSVIPLPIICLALFSLTIFHFTSRQYMAFLYAQLTVTLPILLLMIPVYFLIQRRLLRQLEAWYASPRDPDNLADRSLSQRLQKRLVTVSYEHGALVGGGVFLCLSCSVIAWKGYARFPISSSIYYVILGLLLALADFLITVFISQGGMRKVLERFLADCRGFGYYSGTSASIGSRLFAFSIILLLLTVGISWVASSYLATQISMEEMEKRGMDNIDLLANKLDALVAEGTTEKQITAMVEEYALSDRERVFIYDDQGVRVYRIELGGIEDAALDALLEERANDPQAPSPSQFEQLGSRNYLITMASLPENGSWTMVRADLPNMSSMVVGRLSPALVIILILAIASAVYLTLLLSHNISDPIKRLVKICRVVGTGDLAVKVPVDSLDDVGELSSSYSEMLGSLRHISRGLLQTSQEVNEGAENVVNVSEEIMAAIEELNALVQDLSGQIEHEVEQIRNIEEMMASVAETISNSHSMASQSFEISQDAEKQVQEGRDYAREAVNKIGDFKGMLDESMQALFSLGESSLKIGTIVDIISSIADQTNLLALNAAIEAARVGEHGKGFAVVADEVKKLAQEAASSAQRINDVVMVIQEDVERAKSLMEKGTMGMFVGMETVDRTDQSLASISDIVGQMARLAGTIAQASLREMDESERLSGSLDKMKSQIESDASAYQQIGTSSDQQTQGTMELANTAEQLAEIARRLNEMVAHFKID